jgi:uncharacterized protein YdbL (DUF1318 family)
MVQAMVEVTVGERKLLVTASTAGLIAEAKARLSVRNARISAQLHEARLLPGTPGNQFAGWLGTVTKLHEAEVRC